MKKKLIVVALFILLMLAAIPTAMAACYNHKEVQVSKKAATCTTAGKIEYRCYNCGKGHTETIPKTGHGWGVWYDTVTATCQRKGTQAHNCRNCGTTATRTVDYNRSNHQDYGEWVTKRAACHPSGGYKERKCKCGNVQRENLPKKAHGWGVWYDTDPATCQKKGTQAHNCRDCGTTETRTVDYNRSNHQDFGKWEAKRAACHPSGGYEERKCKCGHTERQNLAKKDHNWAKATFVSRKDPTYLEAGYTRVKCPDCPETKDNPIAKLQYTEVEQEFYNGLTTEGEIDKAQAKKYTEMIASWNLIVTNNLSGYENVGDLNDYVKPAKPSNMSQKDYDDLIFDLQHYYLDILFDNDAELPKYNN